MGVKTYYLRIKQPNGITRRVRLNDNDTLKSLSLTTINAFDGTGFTYTNTNNDYTITKYVGTSTSVKSPIKEVVLTPSTIVPNSISYKNDCFSNNKTITDVDLGYIPFVLNSMANTFYNCQNLTHVSSIPNSVTSTRRMFEQCYNLVNSPTIPNSVTDMEGTYYNCNKLENVPPIPESVVNMDRTFAFCNSLVNIPPIPDSVTLLTQTYTLCSNLVTAPIVPSNVTRMYMTFASCSKLEGNVYIKTNQVTDARNCFSGSSLDKNVYIPFKYSNGVDSATYNSFINAGYSTTTRKDGVLLINWTPT